MVAEPIPLSEELISSSEMYKQILAKNQSIESTDLYGEAEEEVFTLDSMFVEFYSFSCRSDVGISANNRCHKCIQSKEKIQCVCLNPVFCSTKLLCL